jgi:hypothetical protein
MRKTLLTLLLEKMNGNLKIVNMEMFPLERDIKYPYKFMGCTWHNKNHVTCDKCGEEVKRGIIPMSIHWNKCTDGGKTLASLLSLREEKGSELTIEDINPIINGII